MKHTNSPRFVLGLLSVMAALTLCAQQSKEAVILYNSEAVKAQITQSGDVIRIIKPEPDYLAGFKLISYNYEEVFAQAALVPESEKIKAYDVVSAEGTDIYFESGFATLSRDAITRLDGIVNILKASPSAKILISEFIQNENDQLAKNRINSVKKYLQIKGIGERKVQINRLEGVYPENTVRINIVN
jgi:outer membrane protein OmpA-like peptidoglycan-associated protein